MIGFDIVYTPFDSPLVVNIISKTKPKILLLSGYDAASHRYWRNLLETKLSQYQWTQIALTDRNYSWKVRGSSFEFAQCHGELLNRSYDLVVATSMVDMAALRGFIPKLAQIPTLIYFHENQFDYPISNAQPNILNAQLTSVYTALVADKILFNSQYNFNSFISGAEKLLKKLPLGFSSDNTIGKIQSISEVLPVPVTFVPSYPKSDKVFGKSVGDQGCLEPKKLGDDNEDERILATANLNQERKNTASRVPHFLWNHRWEYDKQPDVMFNALEIVKSSGVEFKVDVIGQSFRKVPPCFENAKIIFKDNINRFGFQTRKEYAEALINADFVISSAIHDYQGLSLIEAIGLGAIPIAPKRVAYPEYIPDEYLYDISSDKKQESVNLANKLLENISNAKRKVDVSQFSLAELIPKYHKAIENLINKGI